MSGQAGIWTRKPDLISCIHNHSTRASLSGEWPLQLGFAKRGVYQKDAGTAHRTTAGGGAWALYLSGSMPLLLSAHWQDCLLQPQGTLPGAGARARPQGFMYPATLSGDEMGFPRSMTFTAAMAEMGPISSKLSVSML